MSATGPPSAPGDAHLAVSNTVLGAADPQNSVARLRVSRSFLAADAVLSIEDLRFAVMDQHGEHELLKGITAQVRSGSVLAVIGGSGAGKTTFLNAVVCERQRGRRSGNVVLNGEELDSKAWRGMGAYVAQCDTLLPALTVRETLDFAAGLYQGHELKSNRKRNVEKLLDETGLAACQHVKVGDGMLIKGISGGQFRRLSVAVELLKRPSLLVLDEPTSGLDSAAAEAIMKLLTDIAQENNIIVVCTIHQPSSYIYQLFDQLLVLATGRVCYFGPAVRALAYFAGIGHSSDAGVNPAEFLIRTTNADFCSEAQVVQICDAWSAVSQMNAPGEGVPKINPAPPRDFGAGGCQQVRLLAVRAIRGNLRNPAAFVGRILLSSFTVAFVSVAYLGARQRGQEQVLDRVWAVMWLQQLPAFLCVGAVPTFAKEYACFHKEVKNGLYHPVSYFLANAAVNLPFWVVLTLVSILPMFVILDMNWANLHQIWLLITCYVGVTDTIAQLCGTLFSNPVLGTMVFILQIIVNMIFNGSLLARVDEVNVAMRWLFYVMPSKYSFRSGVLLEFSGLTFDGFDQCLDSTIPIELRYEMSCWGTDGVDVVDALSGAMFPVLSATNTLAIDVAFILGLLVALKLVHLLLLLWLSRYGSREMRRALHAAHLEALDLQAYV